MMWYDFLNLLLHFFMKLTHIKVFFVSLLYYTIYSEGYEHFVKMIENAGGGWQNKWQGQS